MNWFDKNKFFEKLIVLSWVFFLFSCLFLLSFTSHASVPQSSSLPFMIDCDAWSDSQGYSLQDLQDFYDDRWGSYYPCDFSSDDVLIYETNEFSNWYQTYIYYTIIYVPYDLSNYSYDIDLNGTSYNSFDFDINYASFTMRGYNRIVFNSSRGYNDPQLWTNSTNSFNIFYNSNNTVTYISNNFDYFNDSDYPVLARVVPLVITGHAIPPDFSDPDLDINTHFPSSFIWQYPSNPPLFDSSDIPKSIYNIIEWGLKDPNGPFHCLENNLKNSLDFLGDSIKALGESINKNLQNQMSNLYDNFVSLLEPISDSLNYIREPLDVNELESNLVNSDVYELVTVGSSSYTTFINFFNNITVPSTLSFHIPYTILTQSGYIDFDFGWYANIRDSVIPWIVGFLYAGFGLAVFRSIPSIINGVSGILQKGG